MADLSTNYMGLHLKNPFVPSASPLSRDLTSALELEDAGASALVMYSLFEEQILHEEAQQDRFFMQQAIGHAEASDFLPVPDRYKSSHESYLEQLQILKDRLSIPVIASLNGFTAGGWLEHGKELQQAGADALELNVYYIATNPHQDCRDVEARYLTLLKELRGQVSIPIVMKLSSQFSSPVHFIKQLSTSGANGVALFNRFYQPDIDLETREVVPVLNLSTSAEALLRIRWVAILYKQVSCSLAVTGGLHTKEDILKALMVGADVTHLCSALLLHGPAYLHGLLHDINLWLDEHEYQSISQIKGSVSQKHAMDPAIFERVNYLRVLDRYSSPKGVWR